MQKSADYKIYTHLSTFGKSTRAELEALVGSERTTASAIKNLLQKGMIKEENTSRTERKKMRKDIKKLNPNFHKKPRISSLKYSIAPHSDAEELFGPNPVAIKKLGSDGEVKEYITEKEFRELCEHRIRKDVPVIAVRQKLIERVALPSETIKEMDKWEAKLKEFYRKKGIKWEDR